MEGAEPIMPENVENEFSESFSILQKIKSRSMKAVRKVVPGKATRVRLPKGEIARRIEWSMGKGSIITRRPEDDEDGLETVALYPVMEPFSYVRVTFNKENHEYCYTPVEPQMDEKEWLLLDMLKDTMRKTLSYDWELLAEYDKEEYLMNSVESFIRSRGIKVDPVSMMKLQYYITRDFIGYGPIDVMIRDDLLEDISCDGVDVSLFVFHREFESVISSLKFEDEDDLNSYIVALGQRCEKQISVSNPILDGTTSEGHRVQATYSREVTTRGSTFTIRRFKNKPFTPVDLIKYGTASAEMVAYFWLSIENGESMILSGGTASGKTSSLNALALFIPPSAKIVTMEDTREINLPHENWIPGATRIGVGEKGLDGKSAGEIDMYDLVRAALRQRPNYIIVGEVRGKETYIMFQAMATGHTTYATMHADSVKSMVNRLENPPINCPRILLTALRNVVIQVQAKVGTEFVRRMREVIEIVGFEPETNELITNTVYEWDPLRDRFLFRGHSFLFDKIMEMKGMTHEQMAEEFANRVKVIDYMVDKDLNDYRRIWIMINRYYKDPVKTLAVIDRENREVLSDVA